MNIKKMFLNLDGRMKDTAKTQRALMEKKDKGKLELNATNIIANINNITTTSYSPI